LVISSLGQFINAYSKENAVQRSFKGMCREQR